jgi:hypothetical protein
VPKEDEKKYGRKEEEIMIKDKPFGRVLLLALAFVVLLTAGVNAGETKKASKASKSAKSQSKEMPPMVQMMLEPKAIDILKAASSRLASARTMSFTAVVSYESPSRLGTPLVYTTRSEVTLQRPDKLRVITPGDGPASEFYYDGKTMTAFAPAENLVATAGAPPTIDAALETAYDSAAIYFPFADVMISDPYKGIADGLVIAFYIGQSREVGGTITDMVAYANNNVFLQAWIGAEDKLPRRVRAVYRTDLARLRHQMELSNWQLEIAVPADAFTSTRAGSANPIAFSHPNPKSLPYAEPPAKSKSSKTRSKTK